MSIASRGRVSIKPFSKWNIKYAIRFALLLASSPQKLGGGDDASGWQGVMDING
jgi:hypothetical protein